MSIKRLSVKKAENRLFDEPVQHITPYAGKAGQCRGLFVNEIRNGGSLYFIAVHFKGHRLKDDTTNILKAVENENNLNLEKRLAQIAQLLWYWQKLDGEFMENQSQTIEFLL